MSTRVEVRAIQEQESAEWCRLRLAFWPEADAHEMTGEIDAFFGRTTGLAALPVAVFVHERKGGGLDGVLELSVRSSVDGGATPYVRAWYVDTAARRKGIGRALMQAAEQWSLARGFGQLAADVPASNRAGETAHRAVGFEVVSRLVHLRKNLRAS